MLLVALRTHSRLEVSLFFPVLGTESRICLCSARILSKIPLDASSFILRSPTARLRQKDCEV